MEMFCYMKGPVRHH
ncbi:hypothetical protein QRZ05_07985 [Citrobacter amalonaticus]|nr:hypothetical protein [Citrobacter amalonaticus]MDL4617809.1 hypothetical protein [Citrobacter amalonaticus]MDL4621907.1 hypothetical protein [Citrobacter amalonaticus]